MENPSKKEKPSRKNMSRQEKLASWQQLRADKRSANGLQDPNLGKVAIKEPVKPVEVIPEIIIAGVEMQSIDTDSKPLAQKFGKKKKVEDNAADKTEDPE